MKQDVLERLLIDRALGALEPDTAALLEAYLEREPEHLGASEAFEDSVRLAKLVLPPPEAISLPPLKSLPLPERRPAEIRLRRAWWPAELAAALVLGAGLGFLAFRWGEPAAPRVVKNTAFASLETAASASPSAFWSLKRLADLEPKPAPPRAARLTWRSFAQNPQAND